MLLLAPVQEGRCARWACRERWSSYNGPRCST